MCDVLCAPDTLTNAPSEERGTETARNLAASKVLSRADRVQLQRWLQKDQGPAEAKLLYRASRDGRKLQRFHELCDNKGPTVVVAKSKGGHIFGGYAEMSWRRICREPEIFPVPAVRARSCAAIAPPHLPEPFQRALGECWLRTLLWR